MNKRFYLTLVLVFAGIVSILAQTTALVPYEGGYFVKNGEKWSEYRPAHKTGLWSEYKQYREDDTFFYVKNKKCRLAIPKLGKDKIFIDRNKNGKWEVVYNTIDVHHQCSEQAGLFYCYNDGRGREHNGYYVRGDNGTWREYAPGKLRGVWADFKQTGENSDYFIVKSTKNIVYIPKKPELNFIIKPIGNTSSGGYKTMAIYDRSAAFDYNFNYEYHGTLTRKNKKYTAKGMGARISFDNKCNVQVAFDGKHYDYLYTSIEQVSLDGKTAVLITIDVDNKIWLFEGDARVNCKAIGKNAYFLGGDTKEFVKIKELLALGTFRM